MARTKENIGLSCLVHYRRHAARAKQAAGVRKGRPHPNGRRLLSMNQTPGCLFRPASLNSVCRPRPAVFGAHAGRCLPGEYHRAKGGQRGGRADSPFEGLQRPHQRRDSGIVKCHAYGTILVVVCLSLGCPPWLFDRAHVLQQSRVLQPTL